LGSRLVLAVVLGVAVYGRAAAELVLSAPPRETREAGQAMYGPLADHLTKVLGEQVVYRYPTQWLRYAKEMREGKYDIVFDGPHFMAWRIAHLEHTPLVRLPGTLQFYLVVKADDDKNKSLNDLSGKKICGLAPPNLGTLIVYSHYLNPARQPVIHEVQGGFKKIFTAFKAGECQAAIFRTTFYDKKLSESERAITRIIFKSRALPNQGITVGPRVKPEMRQIIATSLTAGDGVAASAKIVTRFGGQAKSFITATPAEFKDINLFLEGNVWGW